MSRLPLPCAAQHLPSSALVLDAALSLKACDQTRSAEQPSGTWLSESAVCGLPLWYLVHETNEMSAAGTVLKVEPIQIQRLLVLLQPQAVA